jgi:hypothetical protein
MTDVLATRLRPLCCGGSKPYIGFTKPYVRLDRRDASFRVYVLLRPPQLPNIVNPRGHTRSFSRRMQPIALGDDQRA